MRIRDLLPKAKSLAGDRLPEIEIKVHLGDKRVILLPSFPT